MSSESVLIASSKSSQNLEILTLIASIGAEYEAPRLLHIPERLKLAQRLVWDLHLARAHRLREGIRRRSPHPLQASA
jgi:hypothetical protein